jgi:hypothetical protein
MSDAQQVATPDAENSAKPSIGDILTSIIPLGGEDSEDEDEDEDDDEYGSEVTQPFFTLQIKPKSPAPHLVNCSCPAVGRRDSSTAIKARVMETKSTRG